MLMLKTGLTSPYHWSYSKEDLAPFVRRGSWSGMKCQSEADCFKMLRKLILILWSDHLDEALRLCIDHSKVTLNPQCGQMH